MRIAELRHRCRLFFFFLGQRTNSLSPLPYPPFPSSPIRCPALSSYLIPLLSPSPSRPFPSSSLSFPTLPLEVGPLNRASLGIAISSPSGVWGEAPAHKRFGVYWSQKVQLRWQQFLLIAAKNKCIFLHKTSFISYGVTTCIID